MDKPVSSMKQRLAELERETQSLNDQLSPSADRPAVLVHLNLAESYRRRVSELEGLLDDPELRDEAMEAVRSMIERIVVTPRDGCGVSLELRGDLARILAVCSENAKTPPRDETGFSFSFGCGGTQLPIPTFVSSGDLTPIAPSP